MAVGALGVEVAKIWTTSLNEPLRDSLFSLVTPDHVLNACDANCESKARAGFARFDSRVRRPAASVLAIAFEASTTSGSTMLILGLLLVTFLLAVYGAYLCTGAMDRNGRSTTRSYDDDGDVLAPSYQNASSSVRSMQGSQIQPRRYYQRSAKPSPREVQRHTSQSSISPARAVAPASSRQREPVTESITVAWSSQVTTAETSERNLQQALVASAAPIQPRYHVPQAPPAGAPSIEPGPILQQLQPPIASSTHLATAPSSSSNAPLLSVVRPPAPPSTSSTGTSVDLEIRGQIRPYAEERLVEVYKYGAATEALLHCIISEMNSEGGIMVELPTKGPIAFLDTKTNCVAPEGQPRAASPRSVTIKWDGPSRSISSGYPEHPFAIAIEQPDLPGRIKVLRCNTDGSHGPPLLKVLQYATGSAYVTDPKDQLVATLRPLVGSSSASILSISYGQDIGLVLCAIISSCKICTFSRATLLPQTAGQDAGFAPCTA